MSGFAHEMPFGATLQADGTVRFRLWAPAQQSVSLVLEGRDAALPLEARGEGWLELVTDAARADSRYSYRLSDGPPVPDPASRRQAEDVHGPSMVVDPHAYGWRTQQWRGRPWHETVLYELHAGAFSDDGNFDGVQRKLDWLERLGVTAIELMPAAEFSGARNWGYDGVLPFAPDRTYGAPEALKALIDAAHERGLMMFLDVVYNHFGPEGNYLARYAPQFFSERHHTPWGAAIDFSQPVVREFFIHNALYWLDEYRFDGLRLDAVHAILDDSPTHILNELATRVREGCAGDRHIHLVLENDANQVRFLRRSSGLQYNAQWNDDFHHAAHVVLTREAEGYYIDYQRDPVGELGRALAEGFVYQGGTSVYRHGATRGEPTESLSLDAFVAFLQNHDQIGNRAFGERLAQLVLPEVLRAAHSILLLCPQVPLLFMGEEWASSQPFQFFCDFSGALAEAVRDGRRREFARFPAFADPKVRKRIPDPNDPATFARSKLDWNEAEQDSNDDHVQFCRKLLEVRRRSIVPRLANTRVSDACHSVSEEGLLHVSWRLVGGAELMMEANLRSDSAEPPSSVPIGNLLHSTHPRVPDDAAKPGWFVAWYLAGPDAAP